MVAKGFGGAERYFVDLSLALAEYGHDVQVICHEHFKGKNILVDKHGVQVQTVRVAGWWDVIAGKKIEKSVAEFTPDVIHAHLARGAYFAGKVRKNTGIPLVVKTHNYVDLKYYRYVDMFVPTTIDQKKYLVEKGINSGNIKLIPNFSSIKPVSEISLSSQDQIRNICAMGRLVKKKGFDVLIKAIKEVIDKGFNIVLHLGGDGPELDKLQHLCRKLGINDKVIFTGWVDDARCFLQNASLFVLPSLDEPFGIVILEAMSQGKPIITTLTKGPCEILDGQMAWFVETGSVNALSDSIISAMENNDMCLQKAQLALDKFRSIYAQEKVIPELVELYKELVC